MVSKMVAGRNTCQKPKNNFTKSEYIKQHSIYKYGHQLRGKYEIDPFWK